MTVRFQTLKAADDFLKPFGIFIRVGVFDKANHIFYTLNRLQFTRNVKPYFPVKNL